MFNRMLRWFGFNKKLVVYLACPYTSEVAGELEERMEAFYRTVACLQKTGVFVISPLFMHQVLPYDTALGNDWNFWRDYSEELIARADEMRVLCLNGWDRSKGVRAEIEIARELGKEVLLITENRPNGVRSGLQ